VPTSGHRSSRSFAVLATRRVWSPAEKRRIVDEASVPGVNVSGVARRNGVVLSLLYRWRKDAAADPSWPAFPAPKPNGDPDRDAVAEHPAFVAVAMLPAPEPPAPPASTAPARQSLIEITLAGPAGSVRTVRVAADVDAGALARIVAALEGKP
jgi:transposase